MHRSMISATVACVVVLALAASGARFSCDTSAFVFADSDPQSSEEFSARNPAAGGIIVTHLNNKTSTYHFDNATMNWVQDAEPQIQCQLDVVTDPQMPNCLNISGMPYCETPAHIVKEIRKNMTETPPTPERMPIWVEKVCQNPNSAYVRIMFGQYGAHFLSAFENSQQLQSSPEYNQNVTKMVTNLLTKKTCEDVGPADMMPPAGARNVTTPSAPGQPPSGPGPAPGSQP